MYSPPYTITSTILNLVAAITEQIVRYEVCIEHSDKIHLRKSNRIQTIHSSLAIEGNRLTKLQITDIIDGKHVTAPVKDIQEVRNAIVAYDMFQAMNPFEQKDLLKAHGIMMKALIEDAGHFRKQGVGVFSENECVHMAPPADRVPILMAELFEWLNTSKDHLLIRSCVFHYEFEFIHPFSDGNGRIGRLWQSLILGRLNSIFEFLPVENLVYANQQEYYDAIAACDKAGESTIFIEFMLGKILETLKTHQGSEIIDGSDEQFDAIFGKEFGVKFGVKFGVNEKKLLLTLNSNPGLTATELAGKLSLSTRAIEKQIKKFRDMKIIERSGSDKNGLWIINI